MALIALGVAPAGAQRRPAAAPQRTPPVQRQVLPAPDPAVALKLLWSTMAAVDQANKTGNYSVLRDLGSAGFQGLNNAATLAQAFAPIRDNRVDLADTLGALPAFEIVPAQVEPGILRMRGRFNLAPTPVGFDLVYQWNSGWRLHGVSVQPFMTGRR